MLSTWAVGRSKSEIGIFVGDALTIAQTLSIILLERTDVLFRSTSSLDIRGNSFFSLQYLMRAVTYPTYVKVDQ